MRQTTLWLVMLVFSEHALSQMQVKWVEGEHLELGDLGALFACAELGISAKECPMTNIQRDDGRVPFSYGEILVSADYYNHAEDFFIDTNLGIKKVLACAHKMKDTFPFHPPDQDVDYTNCTSTGLFNMPGFLEAVTENFDHFTWHNMKAYVRLHGAALQKAQQAFLLRENPEASQKALHEALSLNGFADHYLTDGFAAGHVRTPRSQLKSWAERNLFGFFKATRGHLLSFVMHESEGKDLKTGREKGLPVKNSLGYTWVTRSDSYMHIDANSNDMTFVMPLTATKESFKEILIAWKTGLAPEGVFKAPQYLPLSIDVPLVTKLSPAYQGLEKSEIVDAIYGAMPWFEQFILSWWDIEKMIDQLPAILQQFRNDVDFDLSQDPQLLQRLPSAYIEGQRTLN